MSYPHVPDETTGPQGQWANPHQPQSPAAQPPAVQQQAWGPPPGMHYPMQVQSRNPILYALASALIAGLGTMLGGRVGRGILILCTVAFFGIAMLIPFIGWLLIPVWLAAWAFSIYDGYATARSWNTRHGIIS